MAFVTPFLCLLLLPHAYSFNVDVRGDINRQMAVAEASAVREGRMVAGTNTADSASPGTGKHTWWWRFAHVSEQAVSQHGCLHAEQKRVVRTV
jgi:hypothetical protein